MKLRLSAAFEGDLVSHNPVVLDGDGLSIGFDCSKEGTVTTIWVERQIKEPDAKLPSLQIDAGGIPKIHLLDLPEMDELIALLQYIESLGSLWLNVRQIRWAEATVQWLPESPEEEAKLAVISYQHSVHYDKDVKLLDPSRITKMLV